MRVEDEAARAHGPTKCKSKARGRRGVSIVYPKVMLIDSERWTMAILWKAASWLIVLTY